MTCRERERRSEKECGERDRDRDRGSSPAASSSTAEIRELCAKFSAVSACLKLNKIACEANKVIFMATARYIRKHIHDSRILCSDFLCSIFFFSVSSSASLLPVLPRKWPDERAK